MLLDKPFRTDLRVEREIRALRSAGHAVLLVCAQGPEEASEGAWEGTPLRRVPLPQGRSQRWLHYLGTLSTGRNLAWERWMSRALKGERFDVVHCHDLPIARSGLRVARRANAMAVFDRHEDWPGLIDALRQSHPQGLKRSLLWSTINSPTIWRHWESRVVASADLVITVSKEAGQDLPRAPRDLAVVSNYVDLESLPQPSPLRPPFRPLRLCFAGVLNSMFGLRETLEAAALLPRDAVEIVLVGEGDERPALERIIRERGLAGRVQILGWRPREEALAAVRDAHLGLLPLRDNALTRSTVGNKMFEYMGLERGVLCSGVGVMARIVREAGAGIVVDPWSAPAVAQSLLALVSRPDILKDLGRTAREAVVSTYNWNRERQALIEAYARLETRRPTASATSG